LLLASGETANGVDRLIDRQHPHDFFMELSASVSQNIGPKSSVFLYGGLPGEPAFGPPAFMHREAIMDSPEAPITHHWLDSTHISFGVLTGGIVLDRVKLEVSRFNGREPDQHRWNIETAPLDSMAVRVSWNPTRTLSLQGSWGHFEDPEQLEPGVDQKRWSGSALYAREVAPGWKLAGTLAWGRKTIQDHHGEALRDDAFAAEASVKHSGWTVFGRGRSVLGQFRARCAGAALWWEQSNRSHGLRSFEARLRGRSDAWSICHCGPRAGARIGLGRRANAGQRGLCGSVGLGSSGRGGLVPRGSAARRNACRSRPAHRRRAHFRRGRR
jgi:hypothetical protein